jgi:hypothetical protein
VRSDTPMASSLSRTSRLSQAGTMILRAHDGCDISSASMSVSGDSTENSPCWCTRRASMDGGSRKAHRSCVASNISSDEMRLPGRACFGAAKWGNKEARA